MLFKGFRFIALLVIVLSTRGRSEINTAAYPMVSSKKGLQVQMVDDALQLGVKHAALNFNLSQLLDPHAASGNFSWQQGAQIYHFHRNYVEELDRQIKPLSDRGVLVSLILLNYESAVPEVRRILQHPSYNPKCPNHLSAFNTVTTEGREAYSAAISFLAARWSRPDSEFGRVWNWIVGNEVNSHWFWCNMGQVSAESFCEDYLRTVRLTHTAVRSYSAEARVFLSLEHHWNIRYPGGSEGEAFPARPFLERFAQRSREQGDFDWHIAFHPYPENLFEPRTWNDKTATPDWKTTPRITFRNLQTLTDFLNRPELHHKGRQRRVILSEQGFHTPSGPDGETIQAAAYCYAWMQVQRLDAIDSFILHRHVDHSAEGGLNLGLWTHTPRSICTPEHRKRIYEVFLKADTADRNSAFAFALPLIGIPNWTAQRP